jgi:MFS family permease
VTTDEVRATAIPQPSQQALYACYAAGGTSNALNMMLKVTVPLWAVQLQMSPGLIGIAVGAAGFLPLLLSIHGGVLMDRFGTRRVNTSLAALGTIAVFLYPILPFASAVIVLQMFTGLATNMGWMGAQSMIVQIAPGNTTLIGRFSMYARVGNLAAPVLTGLVWDLTGAWGTFLFITVVAGASYLAFQMAPAKEIDETATTEKTSVRDLLPRFSEYRDAFAMLAIPAIAFVSVVTFVRIAGSGMQSSFYVVYLEQIGITGTMIGVLLGLSEGFAMFGAGVAGKIERALKPDWTMIIFHAGAIVAVAITPFLGGFIALLILAAMARGATQGLGQPVLVSVLSRSVSRQEQGRSIGLRTTVNRVATILIPPLMGFFVEHFGLEASFAITGGLILAICAGLSLVALRIKVFQDA